jgi:hypothetical protein
VLLRWRSSSRSSQGTSSAAISIPANWRFERRDAGIGQHQLC